MQLLSFLIVNVHESQASEHMVIVHNWHLSIPCLLRGYTNYQSSPSVNLKTDPHSECKYPILLRKSDIVQHALCVLHDYAVPLVDNTIRLSRVDCSWFL